MSIICGKPREKEDKHICAWIQLRWVSEKNKDRYALDFFRLINKTIGTHFIMSLLVSKGLGS
jgi:hypothetical protein